ncbi:LOB domain-containing protein 23-like [Malania oleifera]|uniref:LOB domain-containing protein 23-like n=1 Tax=Malania oleifera TaxID=397392 RepID=UPI0025AE5690|nr:LOB domain-containing protein 23-like [Malania oleifera]
MVWLLFDVRYEQQVPADRRGQVADTLYFEAQCRIQDPVYGCVRTVCQLYQQIQCTESEVAKTRAKIAFFQNAQAQSCVSYADPTPTFSPFMLDQAGTTTRYPHFAT